MSQEMLLTSFWWLSLALFAVIPDNVEELPSEEQQMVQMAAALLEDQRMAIRGNDSEQYLRTLSPELREKHRAAIEKTLRKGPGCHNLAAWYTSKVESVTRSQIVVKVKIAIKPLCPTDYVANTEYATLTMVPVYDKEAPDVQDAAFFSPESAAQSPSRIEILEWKTESRRPYDPKID
jgi:hypothetical protein